VRQASAGCRDRPWGIAPVTTAAGIAVWSGRASSWHADAGRWPAAPSDRRALDVHDRGACHAKRPLAHVVVVATEQQFGLMRPVRARWHDSDHHRSGRAAAGTVGPLHGAPVNAVFTGPRRAMPPRPRRSCDARLAGAVTPETHAHVTMFTLSAPAGQGLRLRAPGTYGTARRCGGAPGGRMLASRRSESPHPVRLSFRRPGAGVAGAAALMHERGGSGGRPWAVPASWWGSWAAPATSAGPRAATGVRWAVHVGTYGSDRRLAGG